MPLTWAVVRSRLNETRHSCTDVPQNQLIAQLTWSEAGPGPKGGEIGTRSHATCGSCKCAVLSAENLEHLIHALLKVLKSWWPCLDAQNPESWMARPKNRTGYLPVKLNQMRKPQKRSCHTRTLVTFFFLSCVCDFLLIWLWPGLNILLILLARTRPKRKMLITLCV